MDIRLWSLQILWFLGTYQEIQAIQPAPDDASSQDSDESSLGLALDEAQISDL